MYKLSILKERLPGDKIFLEFFHPPRNIPLPFYAYTSEGHIIGGDSLEDQGIVALFFDRSEQAIAEVDKKYGAYCYSIAYNILPIWRHGIPSRPGSRISSMPFWAKSPGTFPLTAGASAAPRSGAAGR